MPDSPIPAPIKGPEGQVFWDAAAERRFLIKGCTACGHRFWYPRALCPACLGDTEWVDGPDRGTIYSFTVMRRAGPPFILAYVTLADGPTVMTNILADDPDRVAIGDAVELAFAPAEDGTLVPVFAHRGGSAA